MLIHQPPGRLSAILLNKFPIFIKTLIKQVFLKKNLHIFSEKAVIVTTTFRKSFRCKSRNRENTVFFYPIVGVLCQI